MTAAISRALSHASKPSASQAVETVEAQVVEATEQFSQNVEEATPKAAKK